MTGERTPIAFLLNSLEFGGAQRVFIDDANDFARAGFDVSFFILYDGKTELALASEIDPAVHQIVLNAKSVHDFHTLSICAREIKTRNIRTLITTLNDGNRAGQWVVLLSGGRVRLIEREANTLASKTLFQKALDVFFFWAPYRIIAVSGEIQKSLTQLLPFSRNKIVLLPNAIRVHERDSSKEIEARNSVPLILSVGRLAYQKNYELLIASLADLKKDSYEFTVTIVGEGILRKDLERQAQEAGLEDKISFVGHLPHDQVLALYEKADIFVSTSRWEGSPNAVLEALSYGLPVVSTQVGGVPDSITNTVEGLLVPSEDRRALTTALRSVLNDSELRGRLGSAAQERIRKDFSREERFARLRAIVSAT